MARLRKYERVWFTNNAPPPEPQMSEPEVFLAYDFADAVAQSERLDTDRSPHGRHLWSVRPHVGPETVPEGVCQHCLSPNLAEDHCRACMRFLREDRS